MLWLRILSAVIGIPILLGIIYLGNYWLALALLVVIFLGTFELNNIITKTGLKTLLLPTLSGQVVFIIAVLNEWNFWFSLGMSLSILLITFTAIFKFPQIGIKEISVTLFMLIYVGWTLTHILLINNLAQGPYKLIFLFIIIWATDTGAYFCGKFFGKNKLAPQLSPKKTIEGAVGGLLVSVIISNVFNILWQLFPITDVNIIAFIISATGQMGDLLESSFKRFAGIKDSGNIIPGHGGILDRFDSIIISAPVFYYLMVFFNILR